MTTITAGTIAPEPTESAIRRYWHRLLDKWFATPYPASPVPSSVTGYPFTRSGRR